MNGINERPMKVIHSYLDLVDDTSVSLNSEKTKVQHINAITVLHIQTNGLCLQIANPAALVSLREWKWTAIERIKIFLNV